MRSPKTIALPLRHGSADLLEGYAVLTALPCHPLQLPYTTVVSGGSGTAAASLVNLLLPRAGPAMSVRVSLMSYGMRLGIVSATLVPGGMVDVVGWCDKLFWAMCTVTHTR
jgi:hypothetical protein